MKWKALPLGGQTAHLAGDARPRADYGSEEAAAAVVQYMGKLYSRAARESVRGGQSDHDEAEDARFLRSASE
jgi:hypothetical protein